MKPIHIFLCLICLGAVFLAVFGYTKKSDYTFVDFSEVAQGPEKGSQKTALNGSSAVRPKILPLRVAVAAMVSPKQTLVYYEDLLDYIGEKTGREIELIQRKTYAEVNELFPKNMIDLAFVCSGPYTNGRSSYGFEGLATPVVRGEPYYRSYLIVQKNAPYESLEDLEGKVFAFTDPDSNSGALVPRFWLLQKNRTPADFFDRVTYTYSHDNSILAVARGLVDGAAVDGHIWDYYQAKNPYFTAKTRVIKKSDPYGSPPLVGSAFLDPHLKDDIQQVVLTMHTAEQGRKILNSLMIDRFELPRKAWYEPIHTMRMVVDKTR
ncbi:MAG: phosphate/phosphite/phosphonate ABC transporter substrate-binding protein [Desulfotignum sp.]|nr:phosphate/phosphite/phosphonate ABC transporter substrate-binding protein [Desulfotignum sp.]MCF8113406.1 phosphate/phosphite/phosphonate ABC transporter substrate-binding protein [Desulfotignum sp.]MCF8126197.1 phosphate/phosphite/phosphonate ABC transporter substrate-binding protein [Desulfotignum sp.]